MTENDPGKILRNIVDELKQIMDWGTIKSMPNRVHTIWCIGQRSTKWVGGSEKNMDRNSFTFP